MTSIRVSLSGDIKVYCIIYINIYLSILDILRFITNFVSVKIKYYGKEEIQN